MTLQAPHAPVRFQTAPGPRTCGPCVPLMVLEPGRPRPRHRTVAELPELLEAGDVVVLNDSATLPASLHGRTREGAPLELRLFGPVPGSPWRAVLFGAGDWRQDTDLRPPPPVVRPGERLSLAGGLDATVAGVDARHPRLLEVRFDLGGDALLAALYAHAQPVRYRYLAAATAIGDHQTTYAGRPWSVELPSAGRPLSPALLTRLRARGVAVVALTHGAGLSATGDPELDAVLPLPERSHLPAETVAAVVRARAGGHRVLAVGTSVVRALEGRVAEAGELLPGEAVTAHILGPGVPLRVVDGVLAGLHEPGESHYRLLQAFVPEERLRAATVEAAALGYLNHEFGDSSLTWRHRP